MGMNSRSNVSIADALFSSVQQRVLALLFGQPDREFHTSELIRLAGAGSGAVQRELGRLAASGLVTVTEVGNQKRYRANQTSPVFDELHRLTVKTVGLVSPLREALGDSVDRIRAAFVFGSVAKGTDTAKSDIDVMVIADDLSYAEVFERLQKAEEQLGRDHQPDAQHYGRLEPEADEKERLHHPDQQPAEALRHRLGR